MQLDTNSEYGRRVLRRLANDEIIWLTTTSRDGTPQPRPLWFYWNGETILMFSRPDGYKVRHIQERPRVALHLNSTPQGRDIVVILGTAAIESGASEAEKADYLEKYREGIKRINLTRESMTEIFSTAIRVWPEKVRGF